MNALELVGMFSVAVMSAAGFVTIGFFCWLGWSGFRQKMNQWEKEAELEASLMGQER